MRDKPGIVSTVIAPVGDLNYGQPLIFKAKLVVSAPKSGLPLYLDGEPETIFDSGGNATITFLPLPGDYLHVASFPGNANLYAMSNTGN